VNAANGVNYNYVVETALLKLCTFLLMFAVFCSLPLFYDEPFSIIGMSWTEESDILAEDKANGDDGDDAERTAEASTAAGARSDTVQRFQVLDVDVPVTAENVVLEQSSVAGSSASGSTAQQPLLYHQDIAEVNPQLARAENAGRLVSAQPLAGGATGTASAAGAQQAGQQQVSALTDEQRARMTKQNTRAAVKRGLVLLLCVFIVKLCTDISAILGLVGALCMANLGCILPAAFYYRFAELKASQYFSMKSVGGTRVMITGFLGIIGMLVGSYSNISDMINKK